MTGRLGEDYLHERRLTLREVQVIAGAATGFGNAEIGRRLYITENSVKTTLGRALRKLGAADRAQAVVCAIGRGYLEVVNIDGKIGVVPGPEIPHQHGNNVERSVA